MSFDVFFHDIPKKARSLEDIPQGFKPRPLGSRAAVRKLLSAALPGLKFGDDGTGVVQGNGFSAEIYGADANPCESIMVALRGGAQGAAVIDAICRGTGWRAFAPGVEGFISSGDDLGEGFAAWRKYRDQVVAEKRRPSPAKKVSKGRKKPAQSRKKR